MSAPAVVLGVDVGTTATRVVVVEASGTIVHTRCQGLCNSDQTGLSRHLRASEPGW